MRKTLSAILFTFASLAVASDFKNSQWSEPQHLGGVNSTSNEQNAVLSKDELTLYFTSNRPHGAGTVDLDIYVSHRASVYSAWQTPVNLGAPINSAANDFAPNLSEDGHLLFFASARPGGYGDADIYMSRRDDPNDDFGWGVPVNVGPPINTADAEQAPFYLQNAEDGSGNLYFNRGLQILQKADLHYGSVTRDGQAFGDVTFVSELNSTFNDFASTIRKDGREIFFASQRPGGGLADIWTSTRRSIHDPWEEPRNAGAPLSSASADVTPQLSHDGRTLIFASTRPGGLGGNDLWIVTRTQGDR